MHIGADKLNVGSQASVLGWGGAGTPGLLDGSWFLKRIFWLQELAGISVLGPVVQGVFVCVCVCVCTYM